MGNTPSFLPEVKAQWQGQLNSLREANESARERVAGIEKQIPRGEATES